MLKNDLYSIPIKNLSVGNHTYYYNLNNDFFKNIEESFINAGSVKIELEIKKNLTNEFFFKLDGFVTIECDRCLSDLDIDIDCEKYLIAKFGEESTENSDEIIFIPESDSSIDIEWLLYEFIALEIPIKHVHKNGYCNKEMELKLKKYLAKDKNNSQEESNSIENIDPRWEILKKLKKKD